MTLNALGVRVRSFKDEGKSLAEIIPLLNKWGYDGRTIVEVLAKVGFPRLRLVDHEARITALLSEGWAAHAIATSLRQEGLSDEFIISAMANRGHRLMVGDTGEFGYPPISPDRSDPLGYLHQQ